jgi:excisionase family DNA binding protein
MTMFSRPEAAEYLGVSVSTMARWAHQKRGPAYKRAGRKTRYVKADLDIFLDQGCFRPDAQETAK